MVEHSEINDRVRAVIRAALPLYAPGAVRPANQVAPVKDQAFCTVLILSADNTGREVRYEDDALNDPAQQVTESLEWHKLVKASIQFFRDGASANAERLRERLLLSRILDIQRALGIGFVSADPVKNLTAYSSDEFEQRAQFDFNFHIHSVEQDVLATYGIFRFGIPSHTAQAQQVVTNSFGDTVEISTNPQFFNP